MPHNRHCYCSGEIRDAATVVVLRDRRRAGLEVLLLRRHQDHVFGAGADVFPGGAVDKADTGLAANARLHGGALPDAAWRMAALRECFEEAGLLFVEPAELDARRVAAERAALNAGRSTWLSVIQSLDAHLDLALPVAFARFTTPAGQPKRYATRFYALAAPADQIARADEREMTAAEWVAPAAALADADAGQRWLMPPTRATLERLTHYNDTASALAGLAQGEFDG